MRRLTIAVIVVFLGLLVLQFWYPSWWGRFFYPLKYERQIQIAADKYDIDPFLISAIVYEESKFEPDSKSRVGAIGLMQVMPQTADWIAKKQRRSFQSSDLWDPQTNIDLGSWYYAFLFEKYDNHGLALAAYNSGYVNVDRWLQENEGLSSSEIVATVAYPETRDFVKRVLATREAYQRIYADVLE